MLQHPKGRSGNKKTTTGCLTCRIRKIKCDEARPACERCCSTGRKCDGYSLNVNLYVPRQASSSLETPLTIYHHAEQLEITAFEYFIHELSPGFTRIINRDFWHRVIPQSCHSDRIVWNAVNAMSLLIRQKQSVSRSLHTDETTVALRWYSRSIIDLQRRFKSSRSWFTTCYISFVLYICIEILQDNLSSALAILARATAMIDAQVRPHDTSAEDLIVGQTVEFLLKNMAVSQGVFVPSSNKTGQGQVLSAESAGQNDIYELIAESHQFICQIQEIKLHQPKNWTPCDEIATLQSFITTKLVEWPEMIKHVLNDPNVGPRLNGDHEELQSVLTLLYGQYSIALSTVLSMYETSYDKYFDTFAMMVQYADHVISATRSQCIFTFETRLIPSLFFVATRCRHPVIRRQAIALLWKGPKIENTVKAENMARVAERVVAFEEAGGEHGVFSAVAPNVDLPPESNRAYTIFLDDSAGNMYLKLGRWQQDETLLWRKVNHVVKL